jgi:hypothetical protein
MIVYVLFCHKKSVSKKKVSIIFIKNKKFKKPKTPILVGFLGGFFGFFGWVFFGWVFYCQPCEQENLYLEELSQLINANFPELRNMDVPRLSMLFFAVYRLSVLDRLSVADL